MHTVKEYNALVKACDDIYRAQARHMGLSESVLWTLYVLRLDDQAPTQAQLVEALYLPKQTINSALKKMEAQGLVKLEAEGVRKRIYLTPAGRDLCARTADRIIAAEQAAFAALSPEEQDRLLDLTDRFNRALDRAFREENDHG